MYKPERAQTLAKIALDLMAECAVPATPDNYELFYAHAAGDNPAIAQVMAPLLAAKKPFTPDLLNELRLRCLPAARTAEAMEHLTGGMGTAIDEVLGRLEAAGRDAARYSNTLSAASGQLGGERSPADLAKLVDGLLAATHAMELRAKNLENELQASSDQVSDLRAKLDDVRRESLTDALTSIANRKAFDDAGRAAAKAAADGEEVSLLMCDIDHFKKFNDSWGHQTGDQVLRLVANCLSENVKGRDTAARYGGEEFAVVLRGIGLEAATRLAGQIRATVEAKKLVKKSTGDVLGSITISIGVAQFTPGESVETVIRRADSCLYGAKSHGRNMVIDQNDSRMAAMESSAA